jgi:hypothetical protein
MSDLNTGAESISYLWYLNVLVAALWEPFFLNARLTEVAATVNFEIFEMLPTSGFTP